MEKTERGKLKMEKYEALEMEVIEFDTEDVIRGSREMPEETVG